MDNGLYDMDMDAEPPMFQETEDVESPKRSIRDSGYVDCWDSERSDSLSPPRHGRDDSFDSLDSFGSRSQQTPSPDVVLRGSSDGRGSDSESDLPHRKLPDVKKDDMSARRTSYGEPKSVVPFNQYLPNKSNQTAYIPAPLRKKKAEREEFRKSWSTATSPLGGERPFSKSHPETIEEEQTEVLAQSEEECLGSCVSTANPSGKPVQTEVNHGEPLRQPSTHSANKAAGPRNPKKDPEELGKLRRIEQAGIKIMPATQRYGSSQLHMCEMDELTPDIILRKENPFMLSYQRKDSGSEDERDDKIPDLEKDDFAIRRARLNQPKLTLPFNQYLLGSYANKDRGKVEEGKKQKKKQECSSEIVDACNSSLLDACADSQKQTPSSLSEWHESSEEEVDGSFPDIERDDMLARRFGTFQKSTSPVRPSCPPISVVSYRPLKQQGKERKTLQKAESITVTDSAVPEKHPKFCVESPQKLLAQPEHTLEDGKHRVPGIRQDGASSVAHKDLLDSKPLQPGDSLEMQLTERNSQGFTSLKDGHAQTFGSRTPVSDDAVSVSMFDMRCTDEAAVMQPHSQARHEKLQAIHHQLKEEEDRWQDDLARWKSRRRSASQDLFKKEAERKKMERLLTGTEEASERRKSIKTYREIVEEKERRERALHEAYKNARSREEADNILQQYIERFTISEAVLERLEMPKILERSHSAEPNSSSPPKDPNPMRYLRQQSLPAPKYTAKVEATIAPAGGSEASISTGRTSPSKPFVSKAVPMLTAKPYCQPKSTQQVLRTFKVDGKVSMNGEAVNGVEEERERECTTLIFAPSPSRSPKSSIVVDGSSVEGEENSPSTELVLKRLIEHSKDRAQAGTLTEEAKSTNQNEKTDSERLSPDHKDFSTTVSRASPTVAMAEFSSTTNSSLSNHRKEMGSNEEPKKLERGQLKDVEAPVIQKVETLEAPVQDGGIIFPLLKIIPERSQVVLQNTAPQAGTDNSDKSNRFGCWSWDPEEERKRQERWQHEQERVLQERYQKEQDKLKEEWEKAQKEVEEEERKYYEEERKIIEDTVVPFTVTSSSAEPLSTSSSVTDGNGTVNMADVSYSEEEDKQKEDSTQKNLFSEQDGVPFSKSKEYEPWKENMSNVNKEEHIGTSKQRGNEQDPQMSRTERLQPTEMTLPLCPDVTWNQQLLTKQSPRVSDTKQKNFPSEHNLGLPVRSAREMGR
ncbi:LIM and calponin homology domains-containing protein 1 isoform X2 [Lacerta agilis]|uniref:LIM and calponin homology domains-containing protein 1 isoform X2 n=1 Tax=Lacerta agilis TaxID=80427 RepID=UPI001419FA83|nr:LIM and calponin homology domains-containing protein 1 isoform X2 [Lacerta agilis]